MTLHLLRSRSQRRDIRLKPGARAIERAYDGHVSGEHEEHRERDCAAASTRSQRLERLAHTRHAPPSVSTTAPSALARERRTTVTPASESRLTIARSVASSTPAR